MENLQLLSSFLEQLKQMVTQLEHHIVNAAANISSEQHSPEQAVEFKEPLRCIRHNGVDYLYKPRKARRYAFILFLWERVGELVSAEELAYALFDHAYYNWATIRRYGQRVQQYEVSPKNFPFYLQQEGEGFRLIMLS